MNTKPIRCGSVRNTVSTVKQEWMNRHGAVWPNGIQLDEFLQWFPIKKQLTVFGAESRRCSLRKINCPYNKLSFLQRIKLLIWG